MNKPAFIAGQPATINRGEYLILCKVRGLLPKDSTSNQMLCHIDRVWNTDDGEPVYDIAFCGEDPLDQQVLQGVCESQLKPIIASYPTSKFKVGDHVKISIDHYFKLYTPPMAPDLPKRVGTITSILYNALTPTGKCTNKYKVKQAYYGQCEMYNLVEEEDLELWNIRYDTQKKRDPLWNPPDLWEEQSTTRSVIEKIVKETNAKMTIKIPKGDFKQDMNVNVKIPEIDRVIFNDPATIIRWKAWHMEYYYTTDALTGITTRQAKKVQDKTIVKCAPGEEFNKYNGFCAAVTKYVFGTNSEICRIIKNAQDDSAKKADDAIQNSKKPCKYYTEKCGRKYTCKQTYECDGTEKKKCLEYQKNEKKKGGKKK